MDRVLHQRISKTKTEIKSEIKRETDLLLAEMEGLQRENTRLRNALVMFMNTLLSHQLDKAEEIVYSTTKEGASE